jgi:hypothetical protein
MPTAVLTVALDGGSPASGGITATGGQSVQLGATSTVGWNLTRAPIWTIVPSALCGLTVPAGWSTSGSTFTYQGVSPPAFVLPASPDFGKYRFKLDVYQLTVDQATFLNVASVNGFSEVASGETNQFGVDWAAVVSANAHASESAAFDGTLEAPKIQLIANSASPQTLSNGDIGLTGTAGLKGRTATIDLEATTTAEMAGTIVALVGSVSAGASAPTTALLGTTSVHLVQGVDDSTHPQVNITSSELKIQHDTTTLYTKANALVATIDQSDASTLAVSASAMEFDATGTILFSGRVIRSGVSVADADGTINVSSGHRFTMAALTANRNITLGTTGASAGALLVFQRITNAAHTIAIINGGGGAGTLYTSPSATYQEIFFRYDGTNWALTTWETLT